MKLLPNHYQTDITINFDKTSGAEETANHKTLLRLFRFGTRSLLGLFLFLLLHLSILLFPLLYILLLLRSADVFSFIDL